MIPPTPSPDMSPDGASSTATGSGARWIDMSAEEIADFAHRQILGDYGPVSDALTALHLIEAIACRVAALAKALGQ